MSAKVELSVDLNQLSDEAAREVLGLQFFHSPRAYAATKICEEYGFFDNLDIGPKLTEHIQRIRLLELLTHLGAAEMTEQALGLLIITKGQKAARDAAKKMDGAKK